VKKGTTVHPQSTAVTISAETHAAVKAIADKTIGEISPAESCCFLLPGHSQNERLGERTPEIIDLAAFLVLRLYRGEFILRFLGRGMERRGAALSISGSGSQLPVRRVIDECSAIE
jgi:hypothetical protein